MCAPLMLTVITRTHTHTRYPQNNNKLGRKVKATECIGCVRIVFANERRCEAVGPDDTGLAAVILIETQMCARICEYECTDASLHFMP